MEYENYWHHLHHCFDSEVIIKATTPPPYISDLKITNAKDLIIFIHKKENHQQSTFAKQTDLIKSETLIEDSLADLSITGQPLECPFDNKGDDSLDCIDMFENVVHSEDYYYAPVSLMEARKCMTFVNLKMRLPLPVWILTEANDSKRTFLMGCETKSNWNTRWWALAHSNQIEKMPIKNMIDDFEKQFNVKVGFKRSSQVSCVFNMKDSPGVAQNSKCFLEVNWQEPSYEVPIAQADTVLLIECNVGEENCQVSRWWKQLMIMQKYLEIIKDRKNIAHEMDSIQLPSFKSYSEEKTPLTRRVQELLRVSDSMSVCRQTGAQLDTSAFNATIQHLLKDNLQKGQDVTDRLWSLLIEAETYEELNECFQLVIREVRRNPIKPYIFAKNKTRLAYLLRNIKNSTDVELMLEPLKLMVEMGLEKLKRDYIFIFMSSQLARVYSLSVPKLSSFNEVESSQWHTTVDTQLQWLAQVHTVLELLSVVHSSLNANTLMQVTSQALSTFVHPVDSPVPSLLHLIDNRTYQLRASVLTKEVRNYVEGDRLFYKWMLKLSADSDYMGFSSTYILFEESPLPLLISNQLQDPLNDTEILTQSSDINECESNVQEKYSYVQLCTASNKLPSFG